VRRRLFNLAAGVSLLLCVATAALWISSYFTRWERIEIAHRQSIDLLDDDGRPFLCNESFRGVLFEKGSIVCFRFSYNVELGPGPPSGWGFNEGVTGRNLRNAGQWWWRASKPGVFGRPDAYAEVGVRASVVVAALALLPAFWFVAAVRRRRRGDQSLCPICGYDLRATPERCPECGKVPDAVSN